MISKTFQPISLVFVDATVEASQQLLTGLQAGVQAHILDRNQDGIHQITEILNTQYTENLVQEMHIVSHGSPGTLYLGNTELSLATLHHYLKALQLWFSSSPYHPVSPDLFSSTAPSLFLYGCNLAAGDAGEEFITKLHHLTGATIHASANKVGNELLGGDWELKAVFPIENQKSTLQHSFSPFSLQTLKNYPAILMADTDGDGIDNATDVDDDNDGILDTDEMIIPIINPPSLTTTGIIDGGTAVTEIFSDFGGLWETSESSPNPVRPNASHNLLAFTSGGVTYGTGVHNNNAFDTNANGFIDGIDQDGDGIVDRNIQETTWQAVPSTVDVSGVIVEGRANDGDVSTALGPTLVDASGNPDYAAYLTNGDRGLDLGTVVANIGSTWYLSVPELSASSIGDGIPDILLTQLANPRNISNIFTFYDALGNALGQSVRVRGNRSDALGTEIGSWSSDQYPAQLAVKPIRLATLELSEFGLTATDVNNISFIGVDIGEHTDWGFLAFNEQSFGSLYVDIDTDNDGVVDRLDLDSDNDGIADVTEAGGIDPDNDGMVGTGTITDVDNDGFEDSVDHAFGSIINGAALVDLDTDDDGVEDRLDLDSDNDNIPDTVEARPTTGYTTNDGNVTNNDSDGDGVLDVFDNGSSFGGTFTDPVNTDGTDTPDYIDTDSDNDGTDDIDESGLALIASGTDNNDDGIDDGVGADYADPDGSVNNPLTDLTNADLDLSDADYRSLDIFPPNSAPIIDLNSTASAGDIDRAFTNTFTEGGAAVSIADIDMGITDTDDTHLEAATVTLSNPENGDRLLFNGTSVIVDSTDNATGVAGLTFDVSADGSTISFKGTATKAEYETVIKGISFDNTSDDLVVDDRILTITVHDGKAISNIATTTITVVAVNDAPIAADDTFITQEDTQSAILPLVVNDTDPEGDTLTLESIAGVILTPGTAQTISVANGVVNVDASGNITFTPAPNYTGPVSFDYVVSDGKGGMDTGTVNGTITSTNDAPVAVDDGPITALSGSTANVKATTNDNDSDGDALIITHIIDPITGLPTRISIGNPVTLTSGTVVDLQPDGSLNVTSPVTATGSESFDYIISDGILTDSATVSLEYSSSDADNDGVPDAVDLDDDNDGIPDSEEGTGDTDGDGIPDALDLDSDGDGISDLIESGLSPTAIAMLDADNDGVIDSDNSFGPNGLADEVETTPESGSPDYDGDGIADTPVDTDGDGVADFRDLDSDNDGINDVIEAGGIDADGNGIEDRTGGTDTDGDGIPDALDPSNGGTPVANPDTDGDGIADFRDLDSDNDGINDVIEGGNTDGDGDGLVDGGDSDGDGILDAVDPRTGFGDQGDTPAPDTDGDGVADFRDLDSDNDGINDVIEGGNTDADGDGRVNGSDSDGDGIADVVDLADGFGDDASGDTSDSNSDGVPDYLQPGSNNPAKGHGTSGNDVISGSEGNDIINGLSDKDTLDGGTGNDIVNGGSDLDFVVGGVGSDILNGGSSGDEIDAGGGNDIVNAGSGNDVVYGRDGKDLMNGGSGNDLLFGGRGDDLLSGGSGDDTLYGQAGRNLLRGGNGNDWLIGGIADDLLFGGQGDDVFRYEHANEFGDIILDFEIVRDRIDLSSIFNGNASLGSNVVAQGAGRNTMIMANAGSGMQLVAMLTDVNAITIDDSNFIF